MKIRVVVADDFPLVREGEVRALNSDPGIEVIAQAENGNGLGVKGSIVGRMRRVGGHASLQDAPGGGTLVTLVTSRQGA